MDEMTDPVQPDSGQGAGVDGTPYAEYLNRIPEEVRGHVEPIFKEWDSNVTRRFQEHAEFRKQFEPYQPLGLTELSPDEVAWALQFRQAAVSNPHAIRDWYQEYGQQHGLIETAPSSPAQPDPYAVEFEDPTIAALKQQLTPLQQQIEQMNAWRQQQEEQARVTEARNYVETQMSELEVKHPEEFNRRAVEGLVAQYIDTDPAHAVPRAFADWQHIRSQIEKDTLQDKVNQPPPAESGGIANGAAEPIRTLADANRIALEQIRASRGA